MESVVERQVMKKCILAAGAPVHGAIHIVLSRSGKRWRRRLDHERRCWLKLIHLRVGRGNLFSWLLPVRGSQQLNACTRGSAQMDRSNLVHLGAFICLHGLRSKFGHLHRVPIFAENLPQRRSGDS